MQFNVHFHGATIQLTDVKSSTRRNIVHGFHIMSKGTPSFNVNSTKIIQFLLFTGSYVEKEPKLKPRLQMRGDRPQPELGIRLGRYVI